MNLPAYAKRLGVSHSHLWRVITGEREGRSLLIRFGALVEKLKSTSKKT